MDWVVTLTKGGVSAYQRRMRAAQAIALRGHTTKQVAPRKADRRGGGSITVRTTRDSLRRTHSENGSKGRRVGKHTSHSATNLQLGTPRTRYQYQLRLLLSKSASNATLLY